MQKSQAQIIIGIDASRSIDSIQKTGVENISDSIENLVSLTRIKLNFE